MSPSRIEVVLMQDKKANSLPRILMKSKATCELLARRHPTAFPSRNALAAHLYKLLGSWNSLAGLRSPRDAEIPRTPTCILSTRTVPALNLALNLLVG